LIANLGNFINRTLKLAENIDFKDKNLSDEISRLIKVYIEDGQNALSDCKFKEYVGNILSLSAAGNQYLSTKTPWKIKDEKEVYEEIMFDVIATTVALCVMLRPIAPESSIKLATMLGLTIDSWPSLENISELARQVKITNAEPLFKKIEADPEKENFNEKYR
jgi:methionyl-tRNA synthetase